MNNKVQAQFEQHSDNRWIVIIDRTLNRNSDRVITLIAAAPRDRVCVYCGILAIIRRTQGQFTSFSIQKASANVGYLY